MPKMLMPLAVLISEPERLHALPETLLSMNRFQLQLKRMKMAKIATMMRVILLKRELPLRYPAATHSGLSMVLVGALPCV